VEHGLLDRRAMGISDNVLRWGGARISRRLARSVPVFGALIALGTLGYAVRRKGVARGAADTALNAIPYVGALKNAAEVVRGRDFLRDKAPRRA
jgi:hypothetical protein